MADCTLTDNMQINGGAAVVEFFGMHVLSPTAVFGAISVGGTGTNGSFATFALSIAGNTMFIGGAVSADIDFSGSVQISSASFWNCFADVLQGQGTAECAFDQSGGGPLGESNGVPLWGNNNGDLACGTGTQFVFFQMTAAPGPDILPTIQFNNAGSFLPPGGVALLGPEFTGLIDPAGPDGGAFQANAIPWDPTAGAYNGTPRLLTWASLSTALGGGGFLVTTAPDIVFGGTVNVANAGRPDNGGASFVWNSAVL